MRTEPLCFPEDVLRQHAVVLGKTGAGKSSKLRHIVEHLLKQGKRVCIVDPKGDWWGLKKSADGKAPGFPIIAFGDFKEPLASDVPINAQSGKHVAELITSGNRPCILGFRGWMPGALVKFWLDFAPALFNAQSGELYLVIDEVHNFAPKGKILDPDAGRCIHWTNRLMSEGRGLGLVCFIASQRPQKVHNDTLTCCETLIAARVIHKADRQAVKDWIDGCGDGSHGLEVLNGLAQLERPEAWVWSPEAGFGPKTVAFPLFTTFDSFAPPQLQKKVGAEGWSTVNLDDVKAKLASVIEEAKANDPAALKAEVRRLKAELLKLPVAPVVKPEVKEVSILVADHVKLIEQAIQSYRDVHEAIGQFNATAQHLIDPLNQILSHQGGRARTHTAPVVKVPTQHRDIRTRPAAKLSRPDDSVEGDSLPSGEAKILAALIQYPNGLERNQLTVLTGYKRSSRDAYIARLQSKGLVECGDGMLYATQAGSDALPNAQPLPTGAALQNHWLQRLPQGERAILDILLSQYPNEVDREYITAQTGYKRSSRDAYIARMRSKEILTEPSRGAVRAADQLFN